MEAPTVDQILDSAERAASSENFALAESLLRDAARLQESSLGPQHPDLASTFNNLAIVCEKENKVTDAGEFYQRAFAIASASLGSEHPLAITSRDNLDEFNRVHVHRPVVVAPTPLPDSSAEAFLVESMLAAPPPPGRRLALVIGVVAGIVVVGGLTTLSGTRSVPKAVEETKAAGAKAAEVPKAVEEPKAVEVPKAVAETSPTPPAQEKVPVAVSPPSNTPTRTVVTRPVVSTSTDEAPRVVEASLCQSLSTTGAQWECAATSDEAAAGSLYFYTRIAAATSSRVHHRWYQNGRLRQDVDLTIQANPAAGYRTYSRQRLDVGEWRVEAVTADGVVLHEARVAIR